MSEEVTSETVDVPIRVFLLDDHEIVRRGVQDLLEAEPDIEVVGEASTASEALARVPALRSSTYAFPTVTASASAAS
jgi:two-component system, NarL family, response regulator DevR